MIGFDCGTFNLVCCRRDKDGNFAHKREVNAFLEMPLNNRFVFNMMHKSGVPLIERGDVAYALGEAAVEMAYTMTQIELKRPMHHGCVNPKEKDAFQIMSIMMHNLVGSVGKDKEILYYSVPANAVNEETDADYHQKILKSIFDAFKDEKGRRVDAHPINEALALIYAELADTGFTGIGVSCGAGMINLCMSIFGAPVFEFSIVNSGDWIDKQAAKATGETPTFINKEKMKIDLTKEPSSLVERAIQAQYQIMVQKTVTSIKKGIEEAGNKARTNNGVDVIVAGGTSIPNGFDTLFATILEEAKLPIKIGKVIRPPDPLYSVARGALIAAENHSG